MKKSWFTKTAKGSRLELCTALQKVENSGGTIFQIIRFIDKQRYQDAIWEVEAWDIVYYVESPKNGQEGQ